MGRWGRNRAGPAARNSGQGAVWSTRTSATLIRAAEHSLDPGTRQEVNGGAGVLDAGAMAVA